MTIFTPDSGMNLQTEVRRPQRALHYGELRRAGHYGAQYEAFRVDVSREAQIWVSRFAVERMYTSH